MKIRLYNKLIENNWHTPGVNNSDSEKDHAGVDHIFPHTSTMDYVTDEARIEIAELQAAGVDVEIVDIDLSGHYQLDEEKQKLVDQVIAVYSKIPNFADRLVEANPDVAGWLDMAKSMSPLALTFFYNTGNMERPSDGLSMEAILDTPLPIEGVAEEDRKTATELTRIHHSHTPENGEIVLDRVKRFFAAGSLKDGVDAYGLTAHEIMAGSLDRIGDITRAKIAIQMFIEHSETRPELYEGRGVVTASLASGAAEPMFWLLDQLRKSGLQIDTAHEVDLDPIALAASYNRSEHYNLKDKIKMHIQNLLRNPIDSYIDPQSVDFEELIGIIEYLSPELARRLLENAAKVVRPGGMIVFGNMLRSRPQQEWFEGLWPKLRQRSMTEVIEIIEKAGLSRDRLKIRLSKDGLYAMYGIEIPLEDSKEEAPVIARGLGHSASLASL